MIQERLSNKDGCSVPGTVFQEVYPPEHMAHGYNCVCISFPQTRISFLKQKAALQSTVLVKSTGTRLFAHTQDHRQYRQMQFGKKYFATQSAWLMSTFERSNSSVIHALPSCKRVVSYPRTLSGEPSFCKADITLTHFQKQLQPFISSGNFNVCKSFTCTVK